MRFAWVFGCLVLAGCGAGPSLVPPSGHGPAQGWQKLAASPLSPRSGPVAAWVDGRAIFVGGDTGDPCPPNADCAGPTTSAADGAAYDPESRTWTRITPAPTPVAAFAPNAVSDGKLYLATDHALLSYDPAADAWVRLRPPVDLAWMGLVADGHRLLLFSGSDEQGERPDLALDTRTGQWSKLPQDPLGHSFDRTITPTPYGLVLTAASIDRDDQPADPPFVKAALLPPNAETWARLPDSDQLGGGHWVWTGRRLLDASLGGADGGRVNGYGRMIPYGGSLDPASGVWSRLPDPPGHRRGGWSAEAVSRQATATSGWLFDHETQSWTQLERPPGAPAEPGVAVWAGDTLIVFGGRAGDDAGTADEAYSRQVWALDPAG